MATTPEGKVKKAVKKKLDEIGAWHYMPVQTGFGLTGVPDLICCVPMKITQEMVGKTIGLFCAVETKAPGKLHNTTPNQDRVIKAINEHGGFADVVDNAEDVGKRWLPLVQGDLHERLS